MSCSFMASIRLTHISFGASLSDHRYLWISSHTLGNFSERASDHSQKFTPLKFNSLAFLKNSSTSASVGCHPYSRRAAPVGITGSEGFLVPNSFTHLANWSPG